MSPHLEDNIKWSWTQERREVAIVRIEAYKRVIARRYNTKVRPRSFNVQLSIVVMSRPLFIVEGEPPINHP